LTARFGRGFDKSNLHRMIKLSQVFPDREFVGSLAPQLSWTHLAMLLPVRTDAARSFYIEQAIAGRLSAKALRSLIGRQGFERQEIANAHNPAGSAVPADSFRDPYLLDFLGLRNAYDERDIEEAIVHDLEAFLLEVGNGWAFVARQKRMTVDNDDFYLDLLFFSRPLRRLIAVELKVGPFQPAYEGQMKFYLKWLNRHERRDHEEAPIGLILCTAASREQVELLEMHKDGIVVAEYWTDLPPKAELQARIQQIYRAAAERVARRELPAADVAD
jgi:predicted nuclease of restriction endonuclease-like (RecB) superfamily